MVVALKNLNKIFDLEIALLVYFRDNRNKIGKRLPDLVKSKMY